MVKETQGQKTCSEVLDTNNYCCVDIGRTCTGCIEHASDRPCDKGICVQLCSTKRKNANAIGTCKPPKGGGNSTCQCVYKCP